MKKHIVVDEHVSVLGPEQTMLGPVVSGATVVARTAPGCWGPMITPEIIGGHEVTQPIEIEGAEPGDALLIKIKKIQILSLATMSGPDNPIKGRYDENGDAATFARCPKCKLLNPKTVIKGIGPESIRCAACGAPAIPFENPYGYTILFDEEKRFGITVNREVAEGVANRAHQYSSLPSGSKQNPPTIMGCADLVGVWSRLRPFVGNIGTSPAITLPAVRNSKDIAARNIGANNKYGIKEEDLNKIADCHLDCAEVRAGAVVITPVKIPGAGLYLGDIHAVQGDGEIAGHTADVSAEVTIEVHVLKDANFETTILLPNIEDIPEIARPLAIEEKAIIESLSRDLETEIEEEVLPIQVIGTGSGINDAVQVALKRMSKLTGMALDEVRNRCTIAGEAKISRMSGVVQLTMLTPISILDRIGICGIVKEMYQCNEEI
jgi:formamidase